MKNWRTRKGLYEIHESTRKGQEVYHMVMTGDEISSWCKAKNEVYGYIPGLGGDRFYSCWAVVMRYVD